MHKTALGAKMDDMIPNRGERDNAGVNGAYGNTSNLGAYTDESYVNSGSQDANPYGSSDINTTGNWTGLAGSGGYRSNDGELHSTKAVRMLFNLPFP